MKVRILTFLVLFSVVCTSYAQQSRTGGGQQNFNLQEFQEKRAAYLREKMELTDVEFAAFIPLVNEFSKKKYELNAGRKDIRNLQHKNQKTDADYLKLIDDNIDTQLKEAQLQQEYYQKFKDVLPPSKLYKYKKADMDFMRQALRERRASRGDRSNRTKSAE